jgi:hypothetical protein
MVTKRVCWYKLLIELPAGRADAPKGGSAALQRLDLMDEYRFVVHPVVAGHGLFFAGLRPSLQVRGATRLKSGIVALHYRRR